MNPPTAPSPLNAAFVLAPHAFKHVYGPEGYAKIGTMVNIVHAPVTSADVASHPLPWLEDVDLLFTSWGAPVLDARILARMPRLRAVFHAAGSVRTLATDDFWARGIPVVSMARFNALPVAEFTLAAILLGLKRSWHLARLIRQQRTFPPIASRMGVPGNYGTTVGLVSLGMIGRLVCERLRSFDLRVIAHDPLLPDDAFEALGAEPASLEEVFRTADAVSLHTPLIPATQGMITGGHIAMMKPDSTFINTARGAVVREDEMIEALTLRPDIQAVLDVTVKEPPASTSPLYDLPNVFLTPHVAGSLGGECRRLGNGVIEELVRFLNHEPLRFSVTRQEAERQT